MRKSIFIFTLILSLLSCSIFCYADNPTPDAASDEVTIVVDITPTPETTVEVVEQLTSTAEPTASPVLYPVITKNPTNESVYTGDRAVFIARADNAKTITWYLVSPDGATTMLASSVPQLFSGISVSGTDSEKLVLTGVNTKISGYKAYARFGNDEGFVDSTTATISVSASTNPSASPAVTPTMTPRPSATVTPTIAPTATPTIAPIATPSATASVEVTPRPTSEVSVNNERGFRAGFGMVLLLIVLVGIILSAAVILAMYVKGTLDLSWLEIKINSMLQPKENKNTKISSSEEFQPDDEDEPHVDSMDNENNDVDVPYKFYDIDDYKK